MRFRYTGQQFLGGLNLYYYKARFYSPAIGRFLQTDPIGTADDLNLYAYVGNNPINRFDPTGLSSWEAGVLSGGVGGLSAGGQNPFAVDWSKGTQIGYCVPCLSPVVAAAGQAATAVGGLITGLWLGDKATAIYNEVDKGGESKSSDSQRPSKTPNTGAPGATVVNPGSGQERKYGSDGKPEYDIDFDHDHGQGRPHVHNWDRGPNGELIRNPGVPVTLLPEGRPSGD